MTGVIGGDGERPYGRPVGGTTMSVAAAVAAERDWSRETLTALVRFLLDTHHVYTRDAIATLPPLATEARSRHGETHPATQRVESLVYQLAADLSSHMMKEEQVLFPYIEAMESGTGAADSCFGTIRNPIRMMMMEHDTAKAILAELRAATSAYALSAGAPEILSALYRGLEALEGDLHQHIHLENDYLFPGAVRLEQTGPRP